MVSCEPVPYVGWEVGRGVLSELVGNDVGDGGKVGNIVGARVRRTRSVGENVGARVRLFLCSLGGTVGGEVGSAFADSKSFSCD